MANIHSPRYEKPGTVLKKKVRFPFAVRQWNEDYQKSNALCSL